MGRLGGLWDIYGGLDEEKNQDGGGQGEPLIEVSQPSGIHLTHGSDMTGPRRSNGGPGCEKPEEGTETAPQQGHGIGGIVSQLAECRVHRGGRVDKIDDEPKDLEEILDWPKAKSSGTGSAAVDLQLLRDLGQVMRDASICGLGQTAHNAIDSALTRLKVFSA